MSDKFKAIVLNQSGDQFSREIKILDKSFFKTGDVLVKVDYSSLNYKDALILRNGGKLVKEYPHIPGIDFSGKVVESVSSDFRSGDRLQTQKNVNPSMAANQKPHLIHSRAYLKRRLFMANHFSRL